MGERLTRIGMRAFRGVREELTLEFPKGVSAVVLGDNGTGKSTVADALEWYFTGELDLLRHEGRVGSLRHVGACPTKQTSVSVSTTGALGGNLVFDDAPRRSVRAAGRETFLLRGRTLTAFVERTKGEKWKALAQLLGLDDVDQLRLDLQRVRNDLIDAAEAAERDREAAAIALMLPTSPVTGKDVLDEISDLCRKASVAPPVSLELALDPEWAWFAGRNFRRLRCSQDRPSGGRPARMDTRTCGH
jgi:energy-coupling factor transporter ATP-binding protein EcfA2